MEVVFRLHPHPKVHVLKIPSGWQGSVAHTFEPKLLNLYQLSVSLYPFMTTQDACRCPFMVSTPMVCKLTYVVIIPCPPPIHLATS